MPIVRVARAPAAIVTVLVAAGCAAGSTPPSPSLAPTSPAASDASGALTDGGRVTSPRFGWSAVVPAGWRIRAATEDWPPGTNPAAAAPYTDNFEHQSGFPVLDVSTQELPADRSQADFLAELDRFSASLGCEVETEDEATVDGEQARLQRQTCAAGTETVWEVIAFDGDRVYAIYWLSRIDEADADEQLFREMLATFRFAPP
jgi:hypothetical protein